MPRCRQANHARSKYGPITNSTTTASPGVKPAVLVQPRAVSTAAASRQTATVLRATAPVVMRVPPLRRVLGTLPILAAAGRAVKEKPPHLKASAARGGSPPRGAGSGTPGAG